jgi:hypothetical protein
MSFSDFGGPRRTLAAAATAAPNGGSMPSSSRLPNAPTGGAVGADGLLSMISDSLLQYQVSLIDVMDSIVLRDDQNHSRNPPFLPLVCPNCRFGFLLTLAKCGYFGKDCSISQ